MTKDERLVPVPTSERITTAFGSHATAAEVLDDVDLHGKHVLVTGGSSGIGAATAEALAARGAGVTLTGRDQATARSTVSRIIAGTGNPNVRSIFLDLCDPSSIAATAAAWEGPLHILVANAGMSTPELQRTPAGHEVMFEACHLGHFALTLALRDSLRAANGARIVSVSSAMHLGSPVVFDDPDYRFRAFNWTAAYGQAKTANIQFAVGLTERWADDGVVANAATPGIVLDTRLSRWRSDDEQQAFLDSHSLPAEVIKSSAQGAGTVALAAASPILDAVGGRYFEDCREAPILASDRGSGLSGVAAYALDSSNADRLWRISELMVA